MKNLLIALFTVTALVSAYQVKAQDGGKGNAEKRSKAMTEWMKANLNLSADQLTKVEAINKDRARKADSIRASNPGDRKAAMESMRTVQKQADSKIHDILTAEQWIKYESKREEMREKAQERMRQKTNDE